MKLRAFIATLAVVGLVAAGCGDDDDDDAASDTTAPAAETTETAGDTPETRDDAAEGGAPHGTEFHSPIGTEQNLPPLETSKKVGEEDIQEGGVHIWGTVAAGPADALASDHAAELTVNGWTVESSGGEPTGEVVAGFQATSADGRYLSLTIGGPVERPTSADLCVWPAKPDDTNCPQADQ